MNSLRNRWPIVVVVAAAVVVLVVALVVVLNSSGSGPGPTKYSKHVASDVEKKIKTPDGVTLAAEVITPKGSGHPPLIVMPASWGSAETEYHVIGQQLAAAGYIVVGYAQRGFPNSTGKIDLAASATQRDVSTVISWALAHTPADPKRIGLEGVSYGAGISLLAAERDPRVKAVVAMSTWTDLGAAFAQNDTYSTVAIGGLLGGRKRAGHLDNDLSALLHQSQTDPQAAASTIRQLAKTRSAMTGVAALNRNRPAVMIANAYQDSIFAPGQLVPFFNALTTPKRLQLAPGDHGDPERAGLYGQPDRTTDDALSWMNHYLLGKDTGIDRAAPIQLKDATTGAWHAYRTWPSTSAASTIDLARPGGTGPGTASTPSTWTSTVATGTDTAATSGPGAFMPSGLYNPPQAHLAATSPQHAFAWSGAAITRPTLVSGSANLHATLTSSASATTFFAYLYDVAPGGTGRLMSVTPYTATGLTPGAPAAVGVPLQPISWTVPAGDHVTLVIDTVDPRYHSAAPGGSTLTLASTAADPATLGVPVALR